MTQNRKFLAIAIVWSAFAALLTLLPYLAGNSLAPAGTRFMWFIGNNLDQNSYMAWIKQGAEGRILFEDKFTTEPQSGLFFFPFFLILGLISRLTGAAPLFVYHGARVLLAFVLLLSAWNFSGRFIKDQNQRLFFLIILSVSSGFGWLFQDKVSLNPETNPFTLTAADMWITETITFTTMLTKPLFTVSVISMLGIFSGMLNAFESGKTKYAVFAGAAGLFLALTHPYDMVTVYGVLALLCIFMYFGPGGKKTLPRTLLLFSLFFFLTIPAMLYEYLFFTLDPVFKEWGKANLTVSPNPYSYVIGFGLAGLAAIYYSVKKGFKPEPEERLLFAWALAFIMLTYFPFKFQRRLVLGVHIPLCLLAVKALYSHALPALKKAIPALKKQIILAAFVILAVPTNIIFIIDDLKDTAAFPENYNIREADYQALRWIDNNIPEGHTFISSFLMGVYLPSETGSKVYAGHYDQTIDWERKRKEIRVFYSGRVPVKERLEFLRANGIEYVLLGTWEKLLGKPEFPDEYFEKVFDNGDTAVFRVKDGHERPFLQDGSFQRRSNSAG